MIAGHPWGDHNTGKLLYNKRVSQNNCLETFLTQGMFSLTDSQVVQNVTQINTNLPYLDMRDFPPLLEHLHNS